VTQHDTDQDAGAARVGELALKHDLTIAVAESLTGGMISSALAATTGSGDWYRGAVVAYSTEVKHDLLGVPTEEVVTAEAASAMARRVRELLLADVGVGVTGSGGPQPQDGRDPGTVFLAVDGGDRHRVVRLKLDSDDPSQVLAATTLAAIEALVDHLGS
jgi:nicotinamide-nucleotide amidase